MRRSYRIPECAADIKAVRDCDGNIWARDEERPEWWYCQGQRRWWDELLQLVGPVTEVFD